MLEQECSDTRNQALSAYEQTVNTLQCGGDPVCVIDWQNQLSTCNNAVETDLGICLIGCAN